ARGRRFLSRPNLIKCGRGPDVIPDLDRLTGVFLEKRWQATRTRIVGQAIADDVERIDIVGPSSWDCQRHYCKCQNRKKLHQSQPGLELRLEGKGEGTRRQTPLTTAPSHYCNSTPA